MSGDHNQFQKPKSYLDDMNEVRKALEMALMALEDANDMFSNDCSVEDVYADEIEALTKVLEKKSFECPRCGHCCQVDEERMNKKAESSESKRLQWKIKPDGDDLRVCFDYSGKPEDKYIRFVRAGQQEPVAWMHTTGTGHVYFRKKPQDKVFNPQPVYTAPPKREWAGLTADEIWKCNKAKSGSAVEFHICYAHQNVLDFAEAIEAKLKEKNT